MRQMEWTEEGVEQVVQEVAEVKWAWEQHTLPDSY
jgi:hypothetical protein